MSGIETGGADGKYYWCLRHRRVEQAPDACAEKYRLGPYPTPAAAAAALDTVAARNAEWEAEDARWAGEPE